jgi:hypothetical protein
MEPFADFDFAGFWDAAEYYEQEYTDYPVTDEQVHDVEAELGYKLPAAYVALAKRKNGGAPIKSCHRTSEPTSWAEDHVAVTGIYSIGRTKSCSLLGEFGSKFWVQEWGYPPIGVYFADCPSAGHDMLCLDYRSCGPYGEPTVVHVDQEVDYKVTFVSNDFESFIRGLEESQLFDVE